MSPFGWDMTAAGWALAVLSWATLSWAAWRLRTEPDLGDRRWAGALALLTAVAWALRMAAPWGPHDLNVRQVGAWVPLDRLDVEHGLGLTAMAMPLQALAGSAWSLRGLPDLVAVLSALHVPLAVLWGRRLGLGRGAAWLAGVWLAVHPAWIRFGHTDVQGGVETLWTLVALLAGERWASGRMRADAVLVGVATGLAVHARPESMVVLGVVAAWGLLRVPDGWRSGDAWLAAGLAGVLSAPQVGWQLVRAGLGGAVAEGIVGADGLLRHAVVTHGPRHLLLLDPAWTPWMVLVGGAIGLWIAGPVPARVRVSLVVTALGLSLLVGGGPAWTPLGGEAFGFARHQLRALPFGLVALAAGWGHLVHRAPRMPRGGRVVLWGAVSALGLWTLPLAWVPRHAQADFRVFASVWDQLDGCAVYLPVADGDAGLHVHHELLPLAGAVRVDGPEGLVGAPCALYYRSSECSLVVSEPRASCDRFEQAHRLTPIAVAEVPAGPWIFDQVAQDPVRVGLYRVDAEEEDPP